MCRAWVWHSSRGCDDSQLVERVVVVVNATWNLQVQRSGSGESGNAVWVAVATSGRVGSIKVCIKGAHVW